MMVYSCVKEVSLFNLRDFWYPELKSYFDAKNFPEIVIIGNKSDLAAQDPVEAVREGLGQSIAKLLNAHSHVTCSCLSPDDALSVQFAFKNALAAGLAQLNLIAKQNKTSFFKKRKINKRLGPTVIEKVGETYTDYQLKEFYDKFYKVLKKEGEIDAETGLLVIDVKPRKFWTDKIGMASSHQSYEVISIGVDIGEIEYVEKDFTRRVFLVQTE